MKPLLYLVALLGVVSSAAADPSVISGHVRQADGQPVTGAQVALFAVTDLAAGAVAQATTDDAGYFAFSLKALGGSPRPAGFVLGPNYPNPFNPSTIIPYQLPVATPVRLEVFNVLGQHVKTLVEGERPAGAHTALWDATDATGQAVGAGVYFYRLSGGGAQWTRKMVLIDGQAGVATGGAGWTAAARPVEADTPVYGLTVQGAGFAAYVDPAFRVETGMAPVAVVVEAAHTKRQPADSLLGDVDGDGRVDIVDALLVAAYAVDPARSASDLDGEGVEDQARIAHLIALGDVNGDGVLNLTDAALIGRSSVEPFTPLPAGLGKRAAAASNGIPKMYWTDYGADKIQRANLDGSQIEDRITTGLSGPYGLALDGERGKMYWTDGSAKKIQRANLDGSQIEDLITTGLSGPYGLALDVGRGKMYWTDGGADKIQRANLDGSQIEDLITTGLRLPEGLALDVGRGKMYWTDYGAGKIQRANLDGSQVETLITRTTGVVYPRGLALDVGRGKMYWIDQGAKKIQRANLNGTQIENLVTTGLSGPFGLALDVGRGKMYWTDYGADKIQRANLNGTQIENLVTYANGLRDPRGLALDTSGAGSGGDTSGRSGPDLVVESPSVSNNTPTPRQSFTLRATVRNRGTARAAATTLRYYRSANSTITTSDTQVGTDAVSGLSASGTSAESISLNAPSSAGTYYYGACVGNVSGESNTDNNCSAGVRVTVGSGGGGGGGGSGSDDHSNSRANATSLAVGSSRSGEIETGGDVDWFRVQVSRSGTLTVYTTSSIDTYGTLQNSSGSELATDDDGGSGQNFSIEHAVNAGTYYIQVRGYSSSATGSYTVYARFQSSSGGGGGGGGGGGSGGETRADAADLALGNSHRREIEIGGNVDWFRVQVRGSGTLTVYTTGSTDTYGTLQNSSGSTLATDDHEGRGQNFSIEHAVSAGTYYIQVRGGDPSTTGRYTVHARFQSGGGGDCATLPAANNDAHGNTRSAATALALGVSRSGQIHSVDDVDYFSVQVTRSGHLTVYATTVGSYTTNPYGILQNSRGQALVAVDDGSDFNTGPIYIEKVGTYYILIQGSPGCYSIHARFLPSGSGDSDADVSDDHSNTRSGATALALGGSRSGRIETGGDVDFFQMQVSSEGTLTVYTTGSTNTYGVLRLGNPVGSPLARSSSGGSGGNFSIAYPVRQPGRYYIQVGDYDRSVTGSYTIHARFQSGFPDLVVESPSISENRLTTEQSFTLQAAVRNRGTAQSASTTLRYYRSSDSRITTRDTEVGTDAISELSASATSAESITLNAPSDPGAYYYGACVEVVDRENETNNNCSEGLGVTVRR